MSMQNWPEYGIGLVFTPEKNIGTKNEINFLTESMGFDDVYELVENMEESDHDWRFYDSEMDGMAFHPFDKAKESMEPSEMLVIWAKKWMDPFRAAYSGPDEIRNEFKAFLGEYLPESFDWDAHIGEFSLSVFC